MKHVDVVRLKLELEAARARLQAVECLLKKWDDNPDSYDSDYADELREALKE